MLNKWFGSLRGKIILSLLLLIIVPVLYIVFEFYSSSRLILENQLYQANQTAVERKAASMNELNVKIMKASSLIMNDEETQRFLRDMEEWKNEYPDFYSYKLLMTRLASYRNLLFESSAHLALYDSFRGYIHTTWTGTVQKNPAILSQEPWFIRTRELAGGPDWHLLDGIQDEYSGPLLVMSRWLFSERKNGEGIVWIGVSSDTYFYSPEELKKQAAAGFHLLLLGNETPLLGDRTMIDSVTAFDQSVRTDKNGISRMKLNGEEYLVNEAVLPGPGWRLVQLVESQTFSNLLDQERRQSTFLVVFWFFIFIVVFIGLTFRFTKPIKQLVLSMNRVGKGELETEVAVRGDGEVAMLGRNFNKMVLQLKELIANLSEEQQRKQKAQFQALQAQINPHFLTNTMNSIKWMAILSGADHVSEMLSKLGKLLNYTMRHNEEIVRLRDEMDYLQVYMALQEIRYHDNITVTTEIEELARDAEIVKFTLQPIVENCIIHGKRFPLQVDITARIEGDKLLIVICDDGVGMSEESIRAVEEQMVQPHAKFSGIGIRNVNERIKLEFGQAYGVTLDNRHEGGVRATVTLPYRRRQEHEAENIDCGR